MDLDARLHHVAVLGAAGKMGRGIALLLAQELTWRALEHPEIPFVLDLIDLDDIALMGLIRYLREHAVKTAEKEVPRLRRTLAHRDDLVENADFVRAFVDELLLHVRTGKTLHLAEGAHLVFEAAFERLDIKVDLFQRIRPLAHPEAWFFTNTSSIPIRTIEEAAGLQGHLIGYHFYNPPPVQKLLEVVVPSTCAPELQDHALQLAERLGKTVVVTNDVAGFIGNGHFMREALQGIHMAERLAHEHGFPKAVYLVDTVTRDWLLRPMGIFQLIDYVGLDVCQSILRVMEDHLHEGLHSPLLDRFLDLGIKGGQTPLGHPKDGFLSYRDGRPTGAYDPNLRTYVPFEDAWMDLLGPRPHPDVTWKTLARKSNLRPTLRAYFQELETARGRGAEWAREALRSSRAVAQRLVDRGVARCAEDVDRVLTLGFFHLYGPLDDLLD